MTKRPSLDDYDNMIDDLDAEITDYKEPFYPTKYRRIETIDELEEDILIEDRDDSRLAEGEPVVVYKDKELDQIQKAYKNSEVLIQMKEMNS